ncbi:hypothetical protein MRX96_035881 [Rhipicephalus microplus]
MLEQVQQRRSGRPDVVIAGAAVGEQQVAAEAYILALRRDRKQRRRAAEGIQRDDRGFTSSHARCGTRRRPRRIPTTTAALRWRTRLDAVALSQQLRRQQRRRSRRLYDDAEKWARS